MENNLAVLQKFNTELPYDPAIPLLGIHPREGKHIFTSKLVHEYW